MQQETESHILLQPHNSHFTSFLHLGKQYHLSQASDSAIILSPTHESSTKPSICHILYRPLNLFLPSTHTSIPSSRPSLFLHLLDSCLYFQTGLPATYLICIHSHYILLSKMQIWPNHFFSSMYISFQWLYTDQNNISKSLFLSSCATHFSGLTLKMSVSCSSPHWTPCGLWMLSSPFTLCPSHSSTSGWLFKCCVLHHRLYFPRAGKQQRINTWRDDRLWTEL